MKTDVHSRPVSRRQFAVGAAAGAAALTLLPARSIFAAQATPAPDFASLGYPELKITVTDTGFEGVPAETAAGRYLVTGIVGKNIGVGIAFVSPTPTGLSAADFLQLLGGSGGGTPPTGATPEAGGTPPAGEEEGGPEQIPLVVYQMYFAGGAGFPSVGVIDLTPGEYVVWGDQPGLPQQPAVLKVTGDFPKDVKEPNADITATLIDFAISFEGNLTAGKHILKVQNHGAQPHFLSMEKGPDAMTRDQVLAMNTAEIMGTPAAAGGLTEDQLQPAFYSPTQSIGTTTWHPIELSAGTYMAACYFPTAGTGLPHIMNGMVDVFKVIG